MMTLAAELGSARRGSPTLTPPVLQVVLPHLKSLISHFGAACTGPYHVTTGLHGQVALYGTYGSAVDAVIVADRINKDPEDRKAAWVIPACVCYPPGRTDAGDVVCTLECDRGDSLPEDQG